MSDQTVLDDWANRYDRLRAPDAGRPDTWIGIPLVTAALIGMIWSLPVPEQIGYSSPLINFGSIFVMAAFLYYCVLSIRLALGALAFLLTAAAPSFLLAQAGLPLWSISTAVFAPCFAWQLAATHRATGRLRMLKNLQYLMLGPIWLLRAAYRRVGLGY